AAGNDHGCRLSTMLLGCRRRPGSPSAVLQGYQVFYLFNAIVLTVGWFWFADLTVAVAAASVAACVLLWLRQRREVRAIGAENTPPAVAQLLLIGAVGMPVGG